MDTKTKPASKRRILILVMAYVVAGFFLAELFYRVFWNEPSRTYIVEGNDPVYHHIPKAFEKGGLGTFDFRGRKVTVEKNPGVKRVVFIGDSFTYGFTSYDQTIPYHFDRLSKGQHGETPIEVLNFGFVSYSPIIQEIQYKRLIQRLKPDLVVHLLDTYDPVDDVIYKSVATFDDKGEATAVLGDLYFNTGFRRSKFLRFLEYSLTMIRRDWHYIPAEQTLLNRSRYQKDPTILQYALDFSFSIVKRLADRIQQNGSQYVLFQYPWPFHLRDTHEYTSYMEEWGVPNGEWTTPEEHAFGKIVMAFCKEEGLSCFDFAPEVRRMEMELGSASRTRIYNSKDQHFTGFANEQFARFILRKLEQTGFFPSAPVTPQPE